MKPNDFEWDETKNVANHSKHGIWFEHARLIFSDACAVGEYDDREAYGEDRFTIVGMVAGVLLFAAFTERTTHEGPGRQDLIRLNLARRATKDEQNDYYRQNSQGI